MPNNNPNQNYPKWKEVQEEQNKLNRKIELITMRNFAGLLGVVISRSESWEDFQSKWHLIEERLENEINKL